MLLFICNVVRLPEACSSQFLVLTRRGWRSLLHPLNSYDDIKFMPRMLLATDMNWALFVSLAHMVELTIRYSDGLKQAHDFAYNSAN